MYSQRFDLGALDASPAGYDGAVAYARAKRAQLVLADAWATRFGPAGVASYTMHPGWVDTPGLAEAGRPGSAPSCVRCCAPPPTEPIPQCGWPPAVPRSRRRRGPDRGPLASSMIGASGPTTDSP